MQEKLVDKLVEHSSAEECTANINEVKIADENECLFSCLRCHSFSNQPWNWGLFCLFSLVLKKKCFSY